MLVNCIRYTIDPAKRDAFAAYAKGWTDIITTDPDANLIGYFLPTRIAGRTDTAYALIGFASLEAYAAYRERVAADLRGANLFAAADREGFILNEERSFLTKA